MDFQCGMTYIISYCALSRGPLPNRSVPMKAVRFLLVASLLISFCSGTAHAGVSAEGLITSDRGALMVNSPLGWIHAGTDADESGTRPDAIATGNS